MTFPTGTVISTANVDSGDGDPSLARADIYNLITAFNQLVASKNLANGVFVLDGSGKITSGYLPTNYSVTGTINLISSVGVISINNVLRLTQIYTADLGTETGTTSPVAGDCCYLVDGDAGQPCLGVYDGTQWRVVRLMTTVGDVGAAVASTASLVCDAEIV